MSRTKIKLIVTAAALIIALCLVGMGTYAWMTMSTQGEVTGLGFSFSGTGDEWPFEISLTGAEDSFHKEISIADLFTTGGGFMLRPISTFDGVNWYSARYDAMGNVSGYKDVDLALVSNIHREDEVDPELAAFDDVTSGKINYLIWKDIWVRTNDKKAAGGANGYAYELKLNNPRLTNLDENETEFGSYVLPAPRKNTTTGAWYIDDADKNALKCLRVGFLVFKEGAASAENNSSMNAADVDNFFIYEPFADERAEGAAFDQNVIYTKTADGNLNVQQYTGIATGIQDTLLPTEENGSIILTSAAITNAAVGGPNNRTIRQLSSSWNNASLAALSIDEKYNSRYLGEIGHFLSLDGGEDVTGYEGIQTPPMGVIRYGQPRRVRVFIWLEGQDVDCWNHIWGNSMVANIEFRGDQVTTGSGN